MSLPDPQPWLAILRNLRPAPGTGRRSGTAPHKPLLLLALLDAFEEGEMESPLFSRSPNLVVR